MYPVWILPFPGTVHDSDLHKITSILIKVPPGITLAGFLSIHRWAAHDKVDIEEVVEKPALLDHGIAENATKADAVDIA